MTTTIPDPYDRQLFHGKLLDNATIQACKIAESHLGYELTILQGIGGAKASAGTHLEGRAVDLAPADHVRKVKVLRDLGFAAWYRPTLPGVWSEHVHAILIFRGRDNREGLAPAGFDQIAAYDAGLDGLADGAKDPNPYRPSPAVSFTLTDYKSSFKVDPKPPTPTKVTKARDTLTEAIHALGHAATILDHTDPSRVKARDQIDRLHQLKKHTQAALEALPKR